MTKRFFKIFGWLTNSPSTRPWLEIDPYYSPFGKDWETVTVPKNHKLKSPVTGWCSWYAFGEKVTEQNTMANALWLAENRKKIPIEYIQIDDGWTLWGDWQKENLTRFPLGIKFTVDKIKELGFKAGIWLAPFLLDLKSEVAQEHPEWILRNDRGQPVFGHAASAIFPNFLWPKRYILNTHHPKAYKYILDSIDHLVTTVGFDLLKIDFISGLYFDPSLSGPDHPDNLIHTFLSFIKSAYPDVYTLTGISPIAPTAGLTDALRFSDDIVVPALDGIWPINSIAHSARLGQLERNLKARKKLGKIWSLDPDVFVCRPSLGFSEKQITKLSQIISEAKGLVWLGDDLPHLANERVERYIYPLFAPLVKNHARVV